MRSGGFHGLSGNRFHRVAYTEWGDPAAPHVVVCVHALTRTGRDFDALARELAVRGCRVVCPDMPGRGDSDWLEQVSDYNFITYLNDMAALLARLGADTVDWIGSSMGGLIGMMLAAKGNTPVRRLVLNDVGAVLAKAGLERIQSYVGVDMQFSSREAAVARLRLLLAGFGPMSPTQFEHFADTSLRPAPGGGLRLHYDPAIGEALRASPAAEVDLWPVWDALRCPVLLLRGALSDLLSAEVADQMTRRGPGCRLVTFADTGHAPSLTTPEQISAVCDWLVRADLGTATHGQPSAEAAVGPPVDIDNLKSLFRGALEEALTLFLSVAHGVADDLLAVVAGRDGTLVWAAGHKLVGSSRMAGAAALVKACEDLCDAANAADWTAAEAAAVRVVAEVARIEDWIARWRERQDATPC
jgi:pimeloyl-ACP methyl ester carboxylesterase/HPt (histidine-containing phosphotransfer) domain-containing protein